MSQATGASSFRVGRVKAYLRGRIWYLCYHEQGRRRRPRVGADRRAARALAARTNSQLECDEPSALSFDPVTVSEQRGRWLEHHEHTLRSSVQTIRRYRAATDHLIRFVRDVRPLRLASTMRPVDVETFVKYLRTIEVVPNGCARGRKRRLLDKGVKFILETCRALFTYAGRCRHLPANADNPFKAIQIDRMSVENAKTIDLLSAEPGSGPVNSRIHAHRHTYSTLLLLSGARPGEAQQLMRHSDPRLTMQVYTHLGILTTSAALAKVRLPAITGREEPVGKGLENVAKTPAASRPSESGDVASDAIELVAQDDAASAAFTLKYGGIVLTGPQASLLDLLLHPSSDTVEKTGPRSSVG